LARLGISLDLAEQKTAAQSKSMNAWEQKRNKSEEPN